MAFRCRKRTLLLHSAAPRPASNSALRNSRSSRTRMNDLKKESDGIRHYNGGCSFAGHLSFKTDRFTNFSTQTEKGKKTTFPPSAVLESREASLLLIFLYFYPPSTQNVVASFWIHIDINGMVAASNIQSISSSLMARLLSRKVRHIKKMYYYWFLLQFSSHGLGTLVFMITPEN